ncbi:Casein kinase I protein isoform 1 [Hibiscus syriacus]|uniref:Casein kinase I protein isoform 1 n=1 Tax=Hibiscus syriacus TaxID=106335 RepID=A0A6A2ZAJ3_HIBSY|nr:Casein kinase I protein isoform 1 [Hibiscus syriacus]
MEQNTAVTAKRVWSIVKAVLFMMRKGILSKRKLMVDLNMKLKRGKIAGAKAIGNLMFHNYHHNKNRQVSTSFTAEAPAAADEYEFSCSNTPNYIFPFNLAAKKKSNNYYQHFFACTHAPPTLDDDNMATMNAVKAGLEMLNNNDVVAASPMLPGFGQTPLARQIRITDSPFPLRDADEDNDYVDKAAEDFINRFYKDLKLQNNRMAEL